MRATHVFAGIPVRAHDAARAWYEELFGRPPDMIPKEGEAVWRLTQTGSVYIVEDTARAGSALVTIALRDAPAEQYVRDPDGNLLQLFKDPG